MYFNYTGDGKALQEGGFGLPVDGVNVWIAIFQSFYLFAILV